MGLIFFIALNGLLVMGLFKAIRDPKELHALWREFTSKPLIFSFQMIFIGSTFVADWGILSAGRLSWNVSTPWGDIQSWALGGLTSVGCLLLGILYQVTTELLEKKRL